ncbi:hypothetical protein SAMN04487948_105174 [Halogranum amylolyticum]|uniref:PRC-barrel domain-containing protein n=1 Tax=Halogranum amylolyticum TaxID=660520 RepID=A0A1H8SL26_9EURY|nr:hypothetical protein [Halogranum amylolyticum]SEO79341.1 hypothetical protein SAMN04487948_105174 [Halogranum amylolyticum]
MVQTFDITDDEVGKKVVDADGEAVGMVTEVRHGTAYVDAEPGLKDKLMAKLGWEHTDEDAYPLQKSEIDAITDDEIRLRQM